MFMFGEGGAKLVHQLLDFFLRSVALERLTQRVLGGAQIALDVGERAVFAAARHLPGEVRLVHGEDGVRAEFARHLQEATGGHVRVVV